MDKIEQLIQDTNNFIFWMDLHLNMIELNLI